MTKNRYMGLDLFLWLLLMCMLEALSAFALGFFPSEAYMLSVVLPISLIVIMRWGAFGLLHAALGGVLYSILHEGSLLNTITYAIGNLGVALCLLPIRFLGKERVRISVIFTMIYCVIGWVGMNIGRSVIASLVNDGSFFDLLIRFLSTEALTVVIGIIIVLIARKQNGVFEDQIHYLVRLSEEEELKHGK